MHLISQLCKPITFSPARVDHVKNMHLRQLCSLIIVDGIVDPSQTTGKLSLPMEAGEFELHVAMRKVGLSSMHASWQCNATLRTEGMPV